MAVLAKNDRDLSAKLQSLVGHSKQLKSMKSKIRAYHRWTIKKDPLKSILQSIPGRET
ncbi:hypothetical protein RCG23_16695 [Neobacillus sp. PS3-34]|uniref:hypothetical protein n=1 Tax=Neobacillus sp. PS3-34 TaxID=3070678 RepID=UPI0027E1D31D|nr:hypothetical protein [Neobacillus sp. PS3-34]WML47190.1 hypothetical protein RCG23_16695 [Neobacillus sp. PS3-34]